MQQDDLSRMELDGKVSMSADNRKSAEIPAVEGGEGMHAEQRQAFFRIIGGGEGEENIDNPGYGGHQKKEDTGGEKGLLLEFHPLLPVKIKDQGHAKEQNRGDNHLGHKPVRQNKEKEDYNPEIDNPKRQLLQENNRVFRLLSHKGKDYRHADKGNGKGKTEKKGVQLEFCKDKPMGKFTVINGATGDHQAEG